MNDLTYGATLIALFATLVAGFVVEATAPAAPVASVAGAAPAVARSLPCAKESEHGCTTVALAAIGTR
jgi:hypothetical protein